MQRHQKPGSRPSEKELLALQPMHEIEKAGKQKRAYQEHNASNSGIACQLNTRARNLGTRWSRIAEKSQVSAVRVEPSFAGVNVLRVRRKAPSVTFRFTMTCVRLGVNGTQVPTLATPRTCVSGRLDFRHSFR